MECVPVPVNRTNRRISLMVEHRHRAGGRAPTAVLSELAFLRGGPKAILGWIDLGGVRTPICVDLDPAKLTASGDALHPGHYKYSGTTVDPGGLDDPGSAADEAGPAD